MIVILRRQVHGTIPGAMSFPGAARVTQIAERWYQYEPIGRGGPRLHVWRAVLGTELVGEPAEASRGIWVCCTEVVAGLHRGADRLHALFASSSDVWTFPELRADASALATKYKAAWPPAAFGAEPITLPATIAGHDMHAAIESWATTTDLPTGGDG